ncbi:hypothetical protein D3C86_2005380 [compost metagenome]
MTLIDTDEATLRSGHVVEDPFDNVRRDAEGGHAGRGRAPKIVQSPRRGIGQFLGLLAGVQFSFPRFPHTTVQLTLGR